MTWIGTTKTQRVVVGVDDSPAARWALSWAATQARQRGLPLHVVHAIQPLRAGYWVTDSPLPSAVATLRQECTIALRDLLAGMAIPSETAVTITCPYGNPGQALSWLTHEGDLLVIGRRPRGRLSRMFTRSVRAYCARHAPATLVSISAPPPPGHHTEAPLGPTMAATSVGAVPR